MTKEFKPQYTKNIEISAEKTGTGMDQRGFSEMAQTKLIQVGSGTDQFKVDITGLFLGAEQFDNAPFRVDMKGNLTATSATLTGSITATTGTIGGWTISASAIYLDGATDALSAGMASADYPFYAGKKYADRATAPFRVTPAGALTATSATVTGAITTGAGSSLDGIYLVATSVNSSKTNLALQGWTFTGVFSATDYRIVAWTAGTFTSSAGTIYNILANNTGNMVALYYIYLDIAVFTTELQKATSYTPGDGKVLIAVASNNTDTTSKASYQVFGGSGGERVFVDNISANSASTNEFISNTAQIANLIVTNAKINDLAVSKLTAGSITSKAITLAIAAGTGDSYIAGGKTDFTNAENGFILGLDDSDSDKGKFYIGNTTDYFNFNGVNTVFRTTLTDAITIDYGSNILLKEGGSLKFTSVTAPTDCTATLVTTGTGNIDNGTHEYKVTFVNATGETELGTVSNTVTVDATHKQVNLSAIPVSSSGAVTSKKIYRTKADGTNYYLLTSFSAATTTYTDNIADVNLTGEIANNKENNSFGKIIIDTVESLSLGGSNTFVGKWSGISNNVGYNNTGMGLATLYSNTTGYKNVAVGTYTLYSNTEGHWNTGIGHFAGYSLITGNSNVFLGYQAGYYETGSSKLFIDNTPRASEADGRIKALIYGIFAAAPANQKLTINGLLNQSVSKTPANAAATGTAGDICWDANFIYVCVATDTWKKVAIATW